MICSCVTPCLRNRSGSNCTCSCRSRWPQMETLATPGTPIRRGLIVQRARTDSSIRDSFFEDTPIIMVRLVADTGFSITGRCDTFGNMYDRIRRSWTICRARSRLVPGSNTSWTEDIPGTDWERMVLTHGTPASNSSVFKVTRLSTSAAESPRASVWISAVGGENSGKTSTGMSRSRMMPKTISAAATPTTRYRNCRLAPTIQRIMSWSPPGLFFAVRFPGTIGNRPNFGVRPLGGRF